MTANPPHDRCSPRQWLRARLEPDLPARLAGFLGRPVPDVRADLRVVRSVWMPLLAERPELVSRGQAEGHHGVLAGRSADRLLAAGAKLAEARGGQLMTDATTSSGKWAGPSRPEAVARMYVPLVCTELERWRRRHDLDAASFREVLVGLSCEFGRPRPVGAVDRSTVQELVARHASESGSIARLAPSPPDRHRELAVAAAVVLALLVGVVGVRAALRAGNGAEAPAELASPASGLTSEERSAIGELDAAIAEVRSRFDTITDMGAAQAALADLEQAATSIEAVAERSERDASGPFRAAIRERASGFLPRYSDMVAGAGQIEGVGAVLHDAAKRIEDALRRLARGGAPSLDLRTSPHTTGLSRS